jgi:hypothetical protein
MKKLLTILPVLFSLLVQAGGVKPLPIKPHLKGLAEVVKPFVCSGIRLYPTIGGDGGYLQTSDV